MVPQTGLEHALAARSGGSAGPLAALLNEVENNGPQRLQGYAAFIASRANIRKSSWSRAGACRSTGSPSDRVENVEVATDQLIRGWVHALKEQGSEAGAFDPFGHPKIGGIRPRVPPCPDAKWRLAA